LFCRQSKKIIARYLPAQEFASSECTTPRFSFKVQKGDPRMLVLSRRLHEKILLPDVQTAVAVVGINANRVRLGISAPPQLAVLREELQSSLVEWGDVPTPISSPRPRQFHRSFLSKLHAAATAVEQLKQELAPGQSQYAQATLVDLAETIRQLCEHLAVDEVANREACRR